MSLDRNMCGSLLSKFNSASLVPFSESKGNDKSASENGYSFPNGIDPVQRLGDVECLAGDLVTESVQQVTSFQSHDTHGSNGGISQFVNLTTLVVLEDTQSAANAERPLDNQSLPTETSFQATAKTVSATAASAYKKGAEEIKARRQSGSPASRKTDKITLASQTETKDTRHPQSTIQDGKTEGLNLMEGSGKEQTEDLLADFQELEANETYHASDSDDSW